MKVAVLTPVYIYLRGGDTVDETREMFDGDICVDLNKDGQIIGIEILRNCVVEYDDKDTIEESK